MVFIIAYRASKGGINSTNMQLCIDEDLFVDAVVRGKKHFYAKDNCLYPEDIMPIKSMSLRTFKSTFNLKQTKKLYKNRTLFRSEIVKYLERNFSYVDRD